MRGPAQPANRGDRSQRSKVTLWDRPSPRMAASAVCKSSRGGPWHTSNLKVATILVLTVRTQALCHDAATPHFGGLIRLQAMVVPGFCAPTTTRFIAYCLVVFAAGNGHPAHAGALSVCNYAGAWRDRLHLDQLQVLR